MLVRFRDILVRFRSFMEKPNEKDRKGICVSNLVYFADDDLIVLHLLKSFLEKEGYETKGFQSGEELLTAFDFEPCNLVILDVVMTGENGFEITKRLREKSNIPIIMLTSKDDDSDQVQGIELGVDIYLTKPLRPTVLTAYVKTLLQRYSCCVQDTTAEESNTLKCADITIYPDSLQIFCNDKEIALTKTEFSLLSYLVENQKASVSREELLRKIWNYGSLVETRAADDVVKRLRRKLADAGSELIIETVWGHGFKLKIGSEKTGNEQKK